jgi:ubiquinone/menaquinone biosynthesis C-methylase UbiE
MRSRDVFPGVFSRYARAYATHQAGGVSLARRWVLQAVAAQPGERVLDLACGPGTLTLPLAAAVGSQGHVLAADLADGMLELVRETAPAWVETRRMDIERMDVASAAFDVVTCAHGYQFVPDLPGALAEARRVLDAGGRFAASVPVPPPDDRRDVVTEIVESIVPALPTIADRADTQATLWDRGRLASALARAGFGEVAIERCEEEIRYETAGALVHRSLTWWSGAWRMEQLPAAEREAVRERLQAALDQQAERFPLVTSGWSTVFSGRA